MMLEVVHTEKNTTIEKAVSGETLSFSQLIKREILNESTIMKFISNYVHYSCITAWNIENNITPNQAVMFAAQIMERSDLTIEDIVCMMKMATRGDFGPAFNRIDVGVLNEWFQKYMDIRIDHFEQRIAKDKAEFNIPGERTNNTLGLSEIPVFNKKHGRLEMKRM